MKHPLVAIAVASLLGATAPRADAQSRELLRRIETAKEVECTFSAAATVKWDGAAPQAGIDSSQHEAKFQAINVDEGTAESASVYGQSFISVRYAAGYLHFMQISDVGPLFVTTIFPQETTNGRLKAVQVRLEYAATTLPGFATRPEMYFGDCAVTS
ncbi:MAG TPA: hypothetical protein VIC71_03730 [Gammaproteobacteria bacterium]|jgi:hypothetical protein